jgi:hypothetical protein
MEFCRKNNDAVGNTAGRENAAVGYRAACPVPNLQTDNLAAIKP